MDCLGFINHSRIMTTTITIKHGTSYERLALAALATAKNIPSKILDADETLPVEIHTRHIMLRGLNPCVLYLESKYVYPSLLFGEPESQAAMLMLLNELNFQDPTNLTPLIELIDQAKEANPFMLGTQLSLVDIAAAPYWAVMPTNYQHTLARALHLHS